MLDAIVCGDARKLSELLSEVGQCVDATVTSPPYWNLKDYGTPGQIGYGQSKADYLRDLRGVLAQSFALTKPSGSLWLVVGNYRENGVVQLLPLEVATEARSVGWQLREVIIWDKQHSLPYQSKGQLRNTFETILFMSKTDHYAYHVERVKTLDEVSRWWVDFPERFSPRGKTPTNVWSIPLRSRGAWRKPSRIEHFCSFPTALVARILELVTDPCDVVLDPFAGSGIVLAQAAAMGRHYLGTEINPEYVAMFEASVKDEVAGEWAAMKEWRESQASARLDFEQTVMRLRVLKYARQVTRPFTASDYLQSRVDSVLCVAAMPRQHVKGQPIHADITIVATEIDDTMRDALQLAVSRSTRPPLSQYGVKSTLTLASPRDVTKNGLLDTTFFLYPNYKPRSHSGPLTLRDWISPEREPSRASYPKIPLLANVAVDVAWALEE